MITELNIHCMFWVSLVTRPTNRPAGLRLEVVKAKRFPIKLMTVEEASVQMELLGHDFFIFLNADNNSFNVLYRRKYGAYGLIEPEVA